MINPHSATLEEIFEDMAERKLTYSVVSNNYSYFTVHCKITGSYDGVEVSSQVISDSRKQRTSDGIREAYAKWISAAGHGVVGMLAPPIEAEPARIAIPDDLSF